MKFVNWYQAFFILANSLFCILALVTESSSCNYTGERQSNNNRLNDFVYQNQSEAIIAPAQHANSKLDSRIFTNRFAVKVKPSIDPDELAKNLGYQNMGRIGSLEDYYLFIGHHVHKRSIEPHETKHFEDHDHVLWFEQQHVRRRVKRDGILDLPESSLVQSGSRTLKFSDPLYDKQWYFNHGARNNYDMNVAAVWKMGITGRNVVLTILDDGVQIDHPDLIRNYDKKASYDINSGDDNPTPQDNGENKHGTRCAGEIAAEAGNEYCGVGVAYNASIGGVRMLDGTVTDDVEAQALGLNPNHIDVYSASWGPSTVLPLSSGPQDALYTSIWFGFKPKA